MATETEEAFENWSNSVSEYANVAPRVYVYCASWRNDSTRVESGSTLNAILSACALITSYMQAFPKNAREIFEYFNFAELIAQLGHANLLYQVVQRIRQIDLNTKRASNHDMGLAFEELIRRFVEGSNEMAGKHFKPRDIVRLTTVNSSPMVIFALRGFASALSFHTELLQRKTHSKGLSVSLPSTQDKEIRYE